MYQGTAVVFKNGKRVGQLIENGNELSFVYDPDWQGDPISPLFPVGKPLDNDMVRAWFRNMLPAKRRRKAFETLTKLSLDRITQFLSWYGEDLPGDISIIAPNTRREWGDITKIVRDLVGSGDSLDYAAFKLSLAGGEPKTAVRLKDGNFFAPTTESPSTHIIKASKYLTFMEAFTLTLARLTGTFPVVNFEIKESNGMPFLLIKRYDRKQLPDGRVIRLTQEDFCQTLGKDMDKKYGLLGGVEHEDMAQVFRERLGVEDVRNFFAMSFFSILAGNIDDHAKNFSVVKESDSWHLAPAYDLISGMAVKRLAITGGSKMPPAFAEMDERQARAFGSAYMPEDILREDVVAMAKLFDMEPKELADIFSRVKNGIENAVTSISEESLLSGVELSQEEKVFAGKCLDALKSTCEERLESIGAKLEKVFEETASLSNSPRM